MLVGQFLIHINKVNKVAVFMQPAPIDGAISLKTTKSNQFEAVCNILTWYWWFILSFYLSSLFVKHIKKKKSIDLKTNRESAIRMATGSLFQSVGPAIANARPRDVMNCVGVSTLWDRRVQDYEMI